METRIKYIKKNLQDGYYAVQIKKWLFWKTIYTDAIFANITKFIDTLAQIDDFNNKAKSLKELVYDGYAVRNVYKNTGPSYLINFLILQCINVKLQIVKLKELGQIAMAI